MVANAKRTSVFRNIASALLPGDSAILKYVIATTVRIIVIIIEWEGPTFFAC